MHTRSSIHFCAFWIICKGLCTRVFTTSLFIVMKIFGENWLIPFRFNLTIKTCCRIIVHDRVFHKILLNWKADSEAVYTVWMHFKNYIHIASHNERKWLLHTKKKKKIVVSHSKVLYHIWYWHRCDTVGHRNRNKSFQINIQENILVPGPNVLGSNILAYSS